ncbi:MAG: amidohydrolase [SAR202 cluster bacterium]|nr:amidohydrolase [SAR202 cluster bacterium]
MKNGFKVIDADAHLQEPLDIWDKYVEPAFYDRRPVVDKHQGRRFFSYKPGELYPNGGGIRGVRPAKVTERNEQKYGEAFRTWWSAESRLADMDKYGWDKMVCIPGTNAGPTKLQGKDPELIWALVRAYNNWAHDFCSTDSSRLKMVAQIPSLDIEGIVSEARRCVQKLGAVTMMMPKPLENETWDDPKYDAVWNLASELDFPISFHGVSSGSPHTGTRYAGKQGVLIALEHAIGFPFENMISMGHLIYTGILERNPDLRCSFLEGNSGWLPFWLGRLDEHIFGRQGVFFDETPLPMKPSEYFHRQFWVACDGDELGIKGAVDVIGDNKLVWNTDYPHSDAPDPDKALPQFLDQPLSDQTKRHILWDNPARLYGSRILN